MVLPIRELGLLFLQKSLEWDKLFVEIEEVISGIVEPKHLIWIVLYCSF